MRHRRAIRPWGPLLIPAHRPGSRVVREAPVVDSPTKARVTMKVHKLFLCLTAVCVLGAPTAFAQSTTGSISGVVTAKEDGAALPGAQITAVHQPTGTRYNGFAGDDGRFRILNVRVGGPYAVSAVLDSFHTQEATDVFVQLGEDATLRFSMQLASIEETLIVVAESSPLLKPVAHRRRFERDDRGHRDPADGRPRLQRLRPHQSVLHRHLRQRGSRCHQRGGAEQPVQQHHHRRLGEQRPLRPRRQRHAGRSVGHDADFARRHPGARAGVG